eukprot:TRINITY_DN23209_c0_g1_i1.p1 TRINITY_DN23209_c0_g1~~TRINITY_DN23209_c0_g1_i1.p1  ORF type:complete len:239 (+),score=55.75 TRINITY_DN23209_c0_g1_i1:60-776(+)
MPSAEKNVRGGLSLQRTLFYTGAAAALILALLLQVLGWSAFSFDGRASESSLDDILKKEHQRGEHFASLLLLRIGKDQFAWERKTADYPIPAFASCLSLLGGNPEGNEQPFEALQRELREELPTSLANRLAKAAEKFGEFEVETGPPVYPKAIFYTAHVWLTSISEEEYSNAAADEKIPGEGRIVLLNRTQLSNECFNWGFHYVWRKYVREKLGEKNFNMNSVNGIKVFDLRAQNYLN